MKINVLLFAAARDAAGSGSLELELPDDARASDVLAALGQALPQLTQLLPSCRLAVDCSYVASDHPVRGDSEVALIPPVSGG